MINFRNTLFIWVWSNSVVLVKSSLYCASTPCSWIEPYLSYKPEQLNANLWCETWTFHGVAYEDYYFTAVYSGRSLPTFRKNVLRPFSGSKSKLIKHRSRQINPAFRTCMFLTGYSFGLLFAPEDGSSMFFRKVGKLLSDFKASHPRR
jgi:hypothetical protein